MFGRWLEHGGPRKAMFAAACAGPALLVSALGVRLHNIWLLYLGYGVLGGCGLGLGYITPVSTLIKWFPDRPGMATGMAIMGFGGGAMIASPLSQSAHDHTTGRPTSASRRPSSRWAASTSCHVFGALFFRVPAPGVEAGRLGAARQPPEAHHAPQRARGQAIRTPLFYLLGRAVLNVTAGIGMLEQASPMIQEMFRGVSRRGRGGFVGLLSLFNMAGRFGWASLSDRIGRKATYGIFFTLGLVLYMSPYAGRIGSVALFVACDVIILSMYGGGFATIPAYLCDMFGTRYVGAIHGRLLTAWSAAGVLGPVLVNYIREYQIAAACRRPSLQRDDVHHGRPAGRRVPRQPLRQTGRQAPPHETPKRDAGSGASRSPAAHKEAIMKTPSHAEDAVRRNCCCVGLRTRSRASTASIKPKHLAGQIAADVAATAIPRAYRKHHAECFDIANHAAAIGSGLELRRHPAACGRRPDPRQRHEAVQ